MDARLYRCINAWVDNSIFALPFLPAALFALYPKWLLLHDIGFLIAARSSGWQERLGWLDQFAFFRYDIALNFIILPIMAVTLASVLKPRWRPFFVAMLAIVLVIFSYANLVSNANVGRYLSIEMATDALRWGTNNPQYVFAYMSPSGLLKLSAIILLIIATAFWVRHRFPGHKGSSPDTQRRVLSFSLVALPTMTACTGIYTAVPQTTFHQPALQQMAASLFDSPSENHGFDMLSARDLATAFANASQTVRSEPARYFGTARDQDVILFILETGPSRSLDIGGDLTGFPALARLREKSLIATAHHSTYPYTSRAIYSILSGSYPIDTLEGVFTRYADVQAPGLIRNLRAEGYVTATYAPGRSQFTPDEAMLRALGVEHQVVPTALDGPQDGGWEGVLRRDQATLQALLNDIDGWIRGGKRYAAVFMPQVGHAPWHDIAGAGDNYPARGRALIALQDQWLGRIVGLLERHGRLDKTLILVTADHGIRTRKEDPQFSGGTIDDYSFHVPLLLWSPSAFPRGETVRAPTSHIDISVTLLDLLGNRGDRGSLQGMALWDPLIGKRKTFFFGRGYLGADGYHHDGRFYMVNYLFRSVYANDRLAFSTENMIEGNSADARRVFQQLEEMEALRTSWVNRITVDGAQPKRTWPPVAVHKQEKAERRPNPDAQTTPEQDLRH